ncbi:MAG TPA: V-type ATP synthase subunit F [Thermoanaerobaculia bacterium]|nr:V-type ATP synthase subunit F [Thermoanaerobaculia bacterium]
MKNIVFVTAPDARCGFNLAGVGQRVPSSDELPIVLQELMSDAAVGIVVIDERLIDAAIQDHVNRAERHWPGVIVILPSPKKVARPGEDYAMRLIRQAVGYQVRVNL